MYFIEHDPALEFLKLHDKQYKRKNRSSVMEYPYLSRRQLQSRMKMEIPVSCVYDDKVAQRIGGSSCNYE